VTLFKAFLFGLIQGITEFLPVSSSGHLKLIHYFLQDEQFRSCLFFDLVCHLGTLLAILLTYFPIIRQSFTYRSTLTWQLFLATLPLFPLVFLLKPIKMLFDLPQLLGPSFMITALFLFAGQWICFSLPFSQKFRRWLEPLIIGIFQAFALFPGISRSGSTISAAKVLGWSSLPAVQFSFLLAIPTIFGATFLELLSFSKQSLSPFEEGKIAEYIIGFTTSFVVGYISLHLLKKVAVEHCWHYFGWYCLILGILTTWFFN